MCVFIQMYKFIYVIVVDVQVYMCYLLVIIKTQWVLYYNGRNAQTTLQVLS